VIGASSAANALGLAKQLGRSVRTHREAARLSLGALAVKSGVSKGNLSTIEAGAGNPSLETLWRLAGALGLSLGVLLGEAEPPRIRLLRAGDGAPFASESGLTGEMLLTEGRPHRTEILALELPVAANYRSGPHQVSTEEFVLCIAGTLEIGPVGQEQMLRPGDSLWFPADCDHRYASRRGARGLSVISYPTLREA
jgi:XRE family transcriptional regulator, regulator of sulfur utilization